MARSKRPHASGNSSSSGEFGVTFVLPTISDSEDAKRMYQALGKGLVRWQYIETGLYLIAFHLMKTDEQIMLAGILSNQKRSKQTDLCRPIDLSKAQSMDADKIVEADFRRTAKRYCL
jgi:hypothetical protein